MKNMTTIREYLETHCKSLNDTQRIISGVQEAAGRLVGVGKAIGGSDVCPLVSFGLMGYNVIDSAGYYQKANTNSVRLLEEI